MYDDYYKSNKAKTQSHFLRDTLYVSATRTQPCVFRNIYEILLSQAFFSVMRAGPATSLPQEEEFTMNEQGNKYSVDWC